MDCTQCNFTCSKEAYLEMKLVFLHPNWVPLSRIIVSLQEQIKKDFEIVNIFNSPCIKDLVDFKQRCHVFIEYYYNRKKRNSSRIELQAWEKRINFPLMEILYADVDRNSPYSNYRKIYEEIMLAYIEFFDNIFRKEKLDFIISEPVANIFSFLAYLIGKLYNVYYRGIESARFPNRFGIVKDIYGYNRQRTELFEKDTYILNQESLNYLSKLDIMQPDYVKGQGRLPPLITKEMIQKAVSYTICNIKYYKYNRIDPAGGGISFSTQFYFTKRRIQRIFNWYATKSKGLYKRPDTGSEQGYFLFPLQYQPEASTLILAPNFSNQYEVIRNIAISLPIGIKLYVKEHKTFLGTRGPKFYKKILIFPNVELVDPFINTVKLVKNSFGVITITSTVGYETLLLNKPVICLGNVFYDFHPLCFKVTAYPKLKEVLRNIVDGKIEVDPSWPSRFLYAYYETTWSGTFNYMDPNSFLPANIEKISKGLKSTLSKDKIEKC